MFNHKRLSLARKRRRLTGKGLAELAGVSAITVSRLENGENQPDDETMAKLARALAYPIEFFSGDDPEEIDTGALSFRSLSKMSAKERFGRPAGGAPHTPALRRSLTRRGSPRAKHLPLRSMYWMLVPVVNGPTNSPNPQNDMKQPLADEMPTLLHCFAMQISPTV